MRVRSYAHMCTHSFTRTQPAPAVPESLSPAQQPALPVLLSPQRRPAGAQRERGQLRIAIFSPSLIASSRPDI